LATTESYKKQNSNEWEKSTTWWNVTVWGDRAEKVAKLLDKGSQVFVEGKGRMNSYKDKQGIDRQTMEVHADEVKLLAKVDRQESHDSGSEDAPMGINSLADDD
jgi:single-strand DNA-binding protein